MIRPASFACGSQLAVLALMLGTALASPAQAGVPSPANSTVPTCLTICPAGDHSFSVVVRDINDIPLANRTVVLWLSACPDAVIGFCVECSQLLNYDPVLHTIAVLTDATGTAAFGLCGTAYCPGEAGSWVEVSADGVVLAVARFVTTDLDGDLDVDAQDQAIALGAAGGTFLAADQDCSGSVDALDVALLKTHLGHRCPGVVPAARTSWGSVKVTYR